MVYSSPGATRPGFATFEITRSLVARWPTCRHVRADTHVAGRGVYGRGSTIFRVLRRLWIPLLVLVVVCAGAFTVSAAAWHLRL